jgi:hypothetical protein
LTHGDFDFDEIEIVNKRPMSIWLHAKCRKYIDKKASTDEQRDQASEAGAEVEVIGPYDEDDDP